MRTEIDLIHEVESWAQEDGIGPVVIVLIQCGVAPAMAEKIAAGRYKSEPRASLTALLTKALEMRPQAS